VFGLERRSVALEGEIDADGYSTGFAALTEAGVAVPRSNATTVDDAGLASPRRCVCSRSRILPTRATTGKTCDWVRGNFDESE
jgi:hypothetical protein